MRLAFALPPRAVLLTLGLSLLAHVALLLAGGTPPARTLPRAITVASLQPPTVPVALPEPVLAAPAPAPLQQPATQAPAARPAAPVAPRPPALDLPTALAAPWLRLAGPAAWRYRLRQAGQDGEALLEWQPQPDGRYSLRLTRRIGERALPAWESLGRMGGEGLTPERFAAQRGGRDRQAINFDNDRGQLRFSASAAQFDLPEGTQDRLSWWLQVAALVQAQPTPGGRWRLWVASLRGDLREWTFEAVDADPDDAAAGTLHLRRLPLGPQDPGVELWLDPARGYWPVRLRQGDPELRGFEIRWLDAVDGVNS